MEMRVFPFSFPPIRGGAQGGVSPTPTPDPIPDPSPELYDLTNAVFIIEPQASPCNWSADGADAQAYVKWTLSGVVVNDSSGVSSVTIDFSTLDWTAGGNPVTNVSDVRTVDKNDPQMTNESLRVVSTNDAAIAGETVGVSGDVTFTAYDSNGEILKQGTITVVGF